METEETLSCNGNQIHEDSIQYLDAVPLSHGNSYDAQSHDPVQWYWLMTGKLYRGLSVHLGSFKLATVLARLCFLYLTISLKPRFSFTTIYIQAL